VNDRAADDSGYGLVEVISGFFLLAMIAVAILPSLYNGIANASRQSDTASATRQVNALIESARQQAAGGSCAGVTSAVGAHRYFQGAEIAGTSTPYDFRTVGASGYTCTVGTTNTVTIKAFDQSGASLVSVTAAIYVTS
jgi:type II secretory pathway pseudopilin PulG